MDNTELLIEALREIRTIGIWIVGTFTTGVGILAGIFGESRNRRPITSRAILILTAIGIIHFLVAASSIPYAIESLSTSKIAVSSVVALPAIFGLSIGYYFNTMFALISAAGLLVVWIVFLDITEVF